MPVVDGARISMSRHSDSKVHKTVKSAQAQCIGKIVCVVGKEIDREASTTHEEGLLQVSRRRGWIERPIIRIS